MRSPVQKEGGSGFSWDPSSLRIPLEQLEKRYADQPETWKEFVAFAKRTKLGEGQPTVWQWLGGKDTTPAPLAAPKTVADVVAKFTPHDQIDAHVAQQVIGELSKVRTVTLDHKLAALEYANEVPDGEAWCDLAAKHAEEFLRFIPEAISAALPKLSINVHLDIPGRLGEYDPATKALNLSAFKLSGNAQGLRETVWHEMMHWVHLEDGQGYKDRILHLYQARTAGEATKQLPGYAAGVVGKKDLFWDFYMGREYFDEQGNHAAWLDGCEIPTRTMELLADPAEFARHWNNPNDRLVMEEALSILFDQS